MTEAEVAAIWEGAVHALGTGFEGKVENARGYSLVWSGPGSRRSPRRATGPCRARADAVRDLGQRRRLLVRPHEEPLPRRARRALRRAERAAARRLRRGGRSLPRRRRPRPSSTASIRDGIAEAGYPGQPSHPVATASAPARTSRPTRTRPARARSARAWCSRSSRDLLGGRRRPAGRGQLAGHRRRAREALLASRTGSCAREYPAATSSTSATSTAARSSRSRAGRSASTTPRCATASRPSASHSIPSRSSRSRACSTGSASSGSKPASRACRRTTRARSR